MNRVMKAMNMNRLRSFRVATSLLAFCLLTLFSPTTADAQKGGTTHDVGVDGDIQAAIDGASDGDTIQLAAGQYDITTTIDPGGRQVTILGTVDGDGDPTSILDGGGAFRVLICQSGETSTTVFENLVVQNGLATGSFPDNAGGGMYNDSDSSPTLTNCTFTGNSASYGGGMYNRYGSPTLTDCTFTSNSADTVGGGIYNNASSPTLTNCTFTSNSSSDDGGGGMSNAASSPTLTDCTFTGNSAEIGGGMFNRNSSSPTLANCTFTGNSADDRGGGMCNSSTSSPTLTDCTFTGNSADYGGGGMYSQEGSSPPLTNCNFCGNTSTSGDLNIGGSAIDDKSSGNLLLLNCNTGDVNFDLKIDSGDLGYLLALWGASSVLNADINQDGEVNRADLAYILSYFGGETDATTAD